MAKVGDHFELRHKVSTVTCNGCAIDLTTLEITRDFPVFQIRIRGSRD